MKILQVLQDYLPDHVGGAEIHAHQLAWVLSGRGNEVVCLYTKREPDARQGILRERTLDGLRLIECTHPGEYADVQTCWREEGSERAFRKVVERERPDVVHFQRLAGWGAGSLAAAREAGCGTVVSLHDYYLLCDRQTLLDVDGSLCDPENTRSCTGCLTGHPFSDPRWRNEDESECHRIAMTERLAYHRHCMRNAQRVVTASVLLAETMLRAELLDEHQLVHLNAGYPGPLHEARRPSDEPLRVGYLGGLFHAKGVHVLIEAMHLLEGEPIALSIHGPLAWDPGYVAELRAAAEGYPVRFHGRFAYEDLDRVLADLDVVVVPSLWFESMPLPIHEAWRNGLPVVASDLGGMAECVTHGTNGLLFPAGDASALSDALVTLARDRELMRRLASGRPLLASVEAVAGEVEEIYRQCLQDLRA